MSVRLDKWLQVARAFKTRTQATHAVDLNRVRVNGQTAKPHRNLVIGDRVEVEVGDWTRVLIVKELKDKPVAKEEARTLFEDLSPPRPEADPIQRLMRRPLARREKGTGRPTKKERRDIEKWEDGDVEEPEA
jgi:ribosome-associated heat shock protein Hsp15